MRRRRRARIDELTKKILLTLHKKGCKYEEWERGGGWVTGLSASDIASSILKKRAAKSEWERFKGKVSYRLNKLCENEYVKRAYLDTIMREEHPISYPTYIYGLTSKGTQLAQEFLKSSLFKV